MRLVVMVGLGGVLLGGCGDDGTNGSSGLPDPVKSCNDLCQYQPVSTSAQTSCAAKQTILKGYPLTTTAECSNIDSISKCLSCYGALGMSNSDCADLGASCL